MKNGAPRTPEDAAAIERFDSKMAFPLIVSAVVPLFLLPGGNYPWLAAGVFIASWIVFLVDLVFRPGGVFGHGKSAAAWTAECGPKPRWRTERREQQ